jgi:hypothetical protein
MTPDFDVQPPAHSNEEKALDWSLGHGDQDLGETLVVQAPFNIRYLLKATPGLLSIAKA